jgi:hypothetical protein
MMPPHVVSVKSFWRVPALYDKIRPMRKPKKSKNAEVTVDITVELPQGVTGFWNKDEDLHFDISKPKNDVGTFEKTFIRDCFTAARLLNGSFVPTQKSDFLHASFVFCVLELGLVRVAIALNKVYPIVAFAEPDEIEKVHFGGGGNTLLKFVESPRLEDVFRSFGNYTVLTKSQLHKPLGQEMCKQLSEVEMNQIKYWKPATLGHLVFQYWD